MSLSVRSLLTCPLGKCAMTDPVFAADGFVYERSNITNWMLHNSISPMTQQHFAHGIVQPATLISYINCLMASDPKLFAPEPVTPPPELADLSRTPQLVDIVRQPPPLPVATTKKVVGPVVPVSRTMQVPKNRIALVIGQQGRTVHTIETLSATKVHINQTNDPCILTISGNTNDVIIARRAITNVLTSADRRW